MEICNFKLTKNHVKGYKKLTRKIKHITCADVTHAPVHVSPVSQENDSYVVFKKFPKSIKSGPNTLDEQLKQPSFISFVSTSLKPFIRAWRITRLDLAIPAGSPIEKYLHKLGLKLSNDEKNCVFDDWEFESYACGSITLTKVCKSCSTCDGDFAVTEPPPTALLLRLLFDEIPWTRVNIFDIMLAFKAAPKLAAAPEVSAANPLDAWFAYSASCTPVPSIEDNTLKNKYWIQIFKWDKVFKNGSSKICGREKKSLKRYGVLKPR